MTSIMGGATAPETIRESVLPVSIVPISTGPALRECARVIRRSFITVAEEFGLTERNAPTNPAFIKDEAVKSAASRGCNFFGLREGSTLAGCAAIERARSDESLYFIERVAVLPEKRHRGYGALLVGHAIEQARRAGAKRVSIGIIDENEILKRWYERQGFQVTGTQRLGQLPFTVCFMEMPL